MKTYRIGFFGGIDWKRRAWRRPRWVVAAFIAQ